MLYVICNRGFLTLHIYHNQFVLLCNHIDHMEIWNHALISCGSINYFSILLYHTDCRDTWHLHVLLLCVSIKYSSVLLCNHIDRRHTWYHPVLISCVSINFPSVLLCNHIVHKETWDLHVLISSVTINFPYLALRIAHCTFITINLCFDFMWVNKLLFHFAL